MVRGSNCIKIRGSSVFIDTNEIFIHGKLIKLTPKEKGVLLILYKNRGRTVLRSKILGTVWGDSLGNDSGLTQAISRLRQIFKDDPKQPQLIKTIPKMGYQLLLESDPVIRTRHKVTSQIYFFNRLGIKNKRSIRLILILILFIVFLLVFDIKIRIETLPA